MSTFLELCKQTVEKCGISGSITAVTGQRGEMLRVVNWVNEAWHDIQLKRKDWMWMRYEFSFATTANKQSYTPVEAGITSRFRHWHTETFRNYKVSTGSQGDAPMGETDWQTYRETYLYRSQSPGLPSIFAVRPRDKSVFLALTPDSAYQIYGEYQRTPILMAQNTDTPEMPEEFHRLIVHGARMKYAIYENAPEILSEASRDHSQMMDELVDSQVEEFSSGDPLA